ncbi:hypothetical protein B9G55_21980 [Saccharibacillus sp. O16]|nr:hypothetical protein B9G55_21980 [Saccharibacillus sp. O16]
MRCFSRSRLERYALDIERMGRQHLPESQKDRDLEEHLLICESCRKKLQQIQSEQRELERLLYQEPIDPAFTAGVMKAIAAGEGGKQDAQHRQEERRHPGKRPVLIGAAALLILMGGGWYGWERSERKVPASETVLQDSEMTADRIEQLLHDPSGTWEWTQRTLVYDQSGLVQYPDIELIDKKTGSKIQVLAVLSDGLTATVIVHAQDQGQHPGSVSFSPASLSWRDAKGETAADYNSSSMGEDNVQAFTYVLRPYTSGSLTLSGDIFGLMVWAEEEKSFKFDQPLSFEHTVDLKKAQENTIRMLVDDGTYSLPDGLRMELLGITRTPAQIQVMFQFRALDDKWKEAIDTALIDRSQLNFHIEDAEGNVLERFGEDLTYELAGQTNSSSLDRNGDQIHEIAWTYSLKEPINLDRRLKVVVDRLVLPVEIPAEVTLNPAQLSAQAPVYLESGGDQFAFTGAEIQQVDGRSVLELPYAAKLINEGRGTWEAVDGSGRSYARVEAEAKNGTVMRIFDVKQMPSSLTLRRTRFPKLYDHLDVWFDVPTKVPPITKKAGN